MQEPLHEIEQRRDSRIIRLVNPSDKYVSHVFLLFCGGAGNIIPHMIPFVNSFTEHLYGKMFPGRLLNFISSHSVREGVYLQGAFKIQLAHLHARDADQSLLRLMRSRMVGDVSVLFHRFTPFLL